MPEHEHFQTGLKLRFIIKIPIVKIYKSVSSRPVVNFTGEFWWEYYVFIYREISAESKMVILYSQN